ncbi:Synaptosomal-associated protein 25 [Trachymyrmex cornetzi]|uniref:Synaptosomal-associated protein n=1 Tax=Trachymyrmex cornetzi TaxID=471704 RepID=A0A195EH89_9HYME|nr:Synaptosomal-associated protein 25 [Trachymyrmex cornetzi]
MDQINADMREAEKNLTGMEKCCGLCVLPCNKGASFKEDEGTWKGNDDGKVVNNQPQRVMDDRNGIGPQSGYIAKITNDARETEMEENMGQVNTMIGNLRNMAIDMGSELENQNRQIDRINRKGESNETRIAVANQRAHALLKSAVRSITRTVTLVVIVSRTDVAVDDGNGMPLVDPFEPRVRTAPFSTSFAPGSLDSHRRANRTRRGYRWPTSEPISYSSKAATFSVDHPHPVGRPRASLPSPSTNNNNHTTATTSTPTTVSTITLDKKHDAARESISVGDSGTTIVILGVNLFVTLLYKTAR